jgi:hypothetical protein
MGTMMGLLGLPRAAREAMEEVAEKHGLTVNLTNVKNSAVGVGFWFQFEIADEAEKDAVKKQEFMSSLHARVCRGRVKPEDFGRVFWHDGEQYRIVGINRDADKYPIQTEGLNGAKNYRFPLHVACPAVPA